MPLLIDTREALRTALTELSALDPIGVDVERADSDRYWRRAALIQVGGAGKVALIDPLAFESLAELHALLASRTVVLHAMENDLRPLAAAGVEPPRVVDTAVAAAVLGLPTGLEKLLAEVLDVSLDGDKSAMQRADWEARPIEERMLAYAAADVADLPALWRELHRQLLLRRRFDWYLEEMAALHALPPAEERRHWSRLKGVGRLGAAEQGRARALWETRERLARTTDTAPGRIVTDKVLMGLAERPPRSVGELGRRGMRRQAVTRFGEQVLRVLADAAPAPRPARARRPTDADRALAERLRALRAERAEVLGIDAGMLCPSRTLLGAVLSDPASGSELQAALGLRRWQWAQLGPAFCEALQLDVGEMLAEDGDRRKAWNMAELLTYDELSERLEDLEGWTGSPSDGISKSYRCRDFNGSVAFVNRVAELAEEANHHPDVVISWDTVTLTYITHSAGAVTEADVQQAKAVDDRLG